MKVVKDFRSDAIWGVVPYIHKNLEKLSNEESDMVLMNGFQFMENPSAREPYKDYKRRTIFSAWSPCEFLAKKDYIYLDVYDFFTEVYCVCPYTCKFMNEYFGYEKFKFIPYPYTNNTVTEFNNYDALTSWVGSIHGQDHINMVETISKFDYKFITSQKNTWLRHPHEFNKCTHVNLSTEQKLIEISKTKTSISINKLHMSPSSKYNGKLGNLSHHAFDFWDKKMMPQFKVRNQETASCKSLIICQKDDWNVIEDFYEPDKHFIYFETFDELEDILHDVDKNFEKYIPIIENAYEQVQKYSVEKIFEYIKTNDDKLITWKNLT